MNKIETNIFPLRCSIYSPSFQKKAEEVLRALLPQEVLSQNPDIKITGHKVEIGNIAFWFEPGTKKVFKSPKFDSDGRFVRGTAVTDTIAKSVRCAIKALSNHALDLGVIREPSRQIVGRAIDHAASVIKGLVVSAPPSSPIPQPTQSQKIATKIDSLAQKILTYLFPVSDLVGVIRNLIDLVNVIGAMVHSSWFVQTVLVSGYEITKATLALGQCIAAFRILQGCFSLVVGVSKLYLALRLLERCKEKHDADGISIAKDQIRCAALNIVTGLFWITLGILVLTCPQAMIAATVIGIAFTVLQWILFYGLFTADSILSLKTANQNMSRIDRHYLYFINDILNNRNLTVEQMNAATKRFLERVSEVTRTERAKALQKLHQKLGHKPLPSEIDARMKQKRSKKCADIGRTIGLEPSSIKNIRNLSDPVSPILENFETTRAQQDASRILSILCLAINVLGIQCDFSTFAQFFKVDHFEIVKRLGNLLRLGLGGQSCAIISDGGWIAVNAFYGLEDLPNQNLITRLFKKIGPKPHRDTLWCKRRSIPSAKQSLRAVKQ